MLLRPVAKLSLFRLMDILSLRFRTVSGHQRAMRPSFPSWRARHSGGVSVPREAQQWSPEDTYVNRVEVKA